MTYLTSKYELRTALENSLRHVRGDTFPKHDQKFIDWMYDNYGITVEFITTHDYFRLTGTNVLIAKLGWEVIHIHDIEKLMLFKLEWS